MATAVIARINLTVNSGGGRGGQSPAASRTPHFMLGEPTFASTDDVRNYCNGVRALMLQCAIKANTSYAGIDRAGPGRGRAGSFARERRLPLALVIAGQGSHPPSSRRVSHPRNRVTEHSSR